MPMTRRVSLVWATALLVATAASDGREGQNCDFENSTDPGCGWRWEKTGHHGFRVVTGQEIASLHHTMKGVSGPEVDANNNTQGHFLFLNMQPNSTELLNITSPLYAFHNSMCTLKLMMHMSNNSINSSGISVFAETLQNNNPLRWNLAQHLANSGPGWRNHSIQIGRVMQNITIIIEVNSSRRSGHVAIDNLKLSNCFGGSRLIPERNCNDTQHFRCVTGECLAHSHVCDLVKDCPNGEDEGVAQDCLKVPFGARCDFQFDLCGWNNSRSSVNNSQPMWTRFNGTMPKSKVVVDHSTGNSSGFFLYVHYPNKRNFGQESTLDSVLFHPPPPYHSNPHSKFYNSCEIRFFKHQSGVHVGSLAVIVWEYHPKNKVKRHDVFYSYGENKASWTQALITLPPVKYRYRIQIEARSGMGNVADLAVDDITLSPECFGLRVPESEVIGYDYSKAGEIEEALEPATHKDFANQTVYRFTTCGVEGMVGPGQVDCSKEYNGTSLNVTILKDPPFVGVQSWTVPESGIYTVIARGASGGHGSGGHGWSHAAEVRAVLKLDAKEVLNFLVGQSGMSTCRKKARAGDSQEECRSTFNAPMEAGSGQRVKQLYLLEDVSSGGGGGGATFVFKRLKGGRSNTNMQPLLVAAGGGGLGNEVARPSSQLHALEEDIQHGHGFNESRQPYGGMAHGNKSAGPGGGLYAANVSAQAGLALLQGGHGGRGCMNSTDNKGDGGFGGGGGGCAAGGGGGGYAGGNAWTERYYHGEGGYSYVYKDGSILHDMVQASHEGPGEAYVIPAISGCGCEYRCVAFNVQRSRTECVCPDGSKVVEKSCVADGVYRQSYMYITITVVVLVILLVPLAYCCIVQYNKRWRRKELESRRKVLSSADLQLRTLRNDLMTETNPNYEFAGGVCTVRDLKDVPREHLRLVRALGQGAFGEVYQGFYRTRPNDAVEMPVAVKTLPELSTSQAESDFLMEALIMSKFNHPNIVHLIGVCFDRHPRYIVLELLAGGDLKTFLRESRPKPDRPSPLNMRDLLLCCHDVAKGCKYLEDHRFIHRDIAARNCLLTSKGPGRTVKIADFGMAREVYMADYYRKGGKAMLPIKWMPPEAFLDGIFTAKTDVWAFGVLLWEVMSLGYMPYTGCANRDVMNLVVSGGRLEPPPNCPPPVYAIMTSCWNPDPLVRPTFSTVMERLGYCLQVEDPDVVNTPLPTCLPPTSSEDMTVMRPPESNGDEAVDPLDRSPAADYLVPVDKLQLQPQLQPLPLRPQSGACGAVSCEGWMPGHGHTPTRSRSKQPLLQGDSSSSSVGSLLSLDKTLPNNNNNTAANHHTRNGPISNSSHGGKSVDHMRHALPLDPSLLGESYTLSKLSQDAGGAANHSEMSC